jgi:SAM-dependent methyltransferase
MAAEVHGIDVSAPLVDLVSRRREGFRVSLGDVRRLDFPDASFGLVFSNSTLDHFGSRAEIVESIAGFARVLEPGGLLLITLDNPRNPMVGLRNFLPQRPLEATGLVPYFMGVTLPMRELVAVLGGAGFRVLKQRYLVHAPRVVFLHLLRALQKFPTVSGVVLQAMLAMEAAAGFPTAGITGHFSAVLAERTSEGWNGCALQDYPPVAHEGALDYCGRILVRYFSGRASVLRGRLVEIRYADLLADRYAVLERVYAELRLPGWGDCRRAIEKCGLETRPRHACHPRPCDGEVLRRIVKTHAPIHDSDLYPMPEFPAIS